MFRLTPIRAALAALLAHWRRNPLQFLTLFGGLALATALWTGVQAINAEARASYAAAAATLEGVAQMRRWKLARVAVNPALYNPVRGVLQSVSRVSFTVSFDRAPARRADPLAADAVLDADALARVANA